jgi:hypothetical protein
MCEGAKSLVPNMPKALGYNEELVWWLTRQQIGLGLRKRYQVPKELPPELLALVRKLDAGEDYSSMRAGNLSESDFLP